MSETHPSSPSLKKGRTSQRLRKLMDCWPLLIWLAVFALAIAGYSKGIVFTRMNGVVDVYQQSIAPTEEGRFDRLEEGIETGKRVEAGEVIAYMDTSMIDLEISRFKERRRLRGQGDLERAHRRLVELTNDQWEAEQKLNQVNAEYDLYNKQLIAISKSNQRGLQQQKAELEFKVTMLEIEKNSRLQRYEGIKAAVAERTEIYNQIKSGDQAEIPMDAEDQQQLAMMELRKERTILKAQRAGTVDRILKEPGEFVEAGQSIAKVVAEPTHILGFLPQQEIESLQQGAEVWVTSTIDRYTTFESKIIDLSPRIDNVRDAASPLPNQAVRGRTVLIEYPEGSNLLPGQTVIIHLQPPGQISFLSKLFGMF